MDKPINKIELNSETLLDLTGDDVQPENVDEGINFHTADGQQRQGTKVVDTAMSDTSENAVQNKVIKAYVDNSIGTVINANY